MPPNLAAKDLVLITTSLEDWTGSNRRQLLQITTHDQIRSSEQFIVLACNLSESLIDSSEHVGREHTHFIDADALHISEDHAVCVKITVRQSTIVVKGELKRSLNRGSTNGDSGLSSTCTHAFVSQLPLVL